MHKFSSTSKLSDSDNIWLLKRNTFFRLLLLTRSFGSKKTIEFDSIDWESVSLSFQWNPKENIPFINRKIMIWLTHGSWRK